MLTLNAADALVEQSRQCSSSKGQPTVGLGLRADSHTWRQACGALCDPEVLGGTFLP